MVSPDDDASGVNLAGILGDAGADPKGLVEAARGGV